MQLILQRELRREARRTRAAAVRFTCSVIGFVASIFLLLSQSGGGADGQRVFQILTFLGFVFCLIAGVRVAAGTIADEKRDGTLSLLFLTQLRPSEIIGGKFFAVAIPLIQPLLAFIPALAITVLHGGVTGSEVFRAIVVIGSTLFLSIAAGLCISSFSRRNEIASRTTLGLLAALLGLPLLFADGPFSFLRLFSAWTAFQTISDEYFRLHPYDFASGTLVLQCLALTLMICAVCFLPTRWGLPIEASSRSLRKRLVVAWHTFVEHAFPELRDSLNRLRNVQGRSAILDRNPGEWLAVREGVNYLEQVPFLIALVILALIAASGSATGPTPTPALWAVIGSAVLLLARLASQASFPLCNMRRSGAVEMLLSTPLDPLQIVTGQVAALRKQFTIPSIIVLAGGFFYAIRASGGPFEGVFGFLMLGFIMMVWTVSIGALGLFIGLLEKSPATAFFQTILIGIFVAGPISMLSTPFPIAFLFLLGFSGNRLTSPDLVRLLKRQPYARKAALA
jgi:ABC-type transport system involved in cytochrome c biogenesis permease component